MSSSYVNQGATVGLESDSINIKKKGREFLVDLRITIKVSPTSGFDAMLFALFCLKHVAGLYGDALRDRRRGS